MDSEAAAEFEQSVRKSRKQMAGMAITSPGGCRAS